MPVFQPVKDKNIANTKNKKQTIKNKHLKTIDYYGIDAEYLYCDYNKEWWGDYENYGYGYNYSSAYHR
jgi:hypothetical protein